ncbi:MAG TPA: PadR family transcriptional regulator [Solirubrobacteraceae bacterium]|nr:PadR family transcriptional regulator [Solirubrobacteraceae bacterium]
MSNEIELTHTSHIVLGLISAAGEVSPYDLKQMAAATIGNFWSLPHSQLYAEPARLAGGGYLTERREEHGRRRKLYALTDRGREAHGQWLQVLTPEPYMLRDLALLKLFFGADVQALARVQLQTHRRKLAEYEQLTEQIAEYGPPGPRLALDLGTRHERQTVEFWDENSRD